MKKDALAAWSSHFSSSLEKRIVDGKVREERLRSLKFGHFELRWQMMDNQVLFQCGTENIPHISSNANMPLLWIIELFNCAKEILTHNLLSSYPVHCAFKHDYEKLAMKSARCWSSEKLIQQEKIHRWWSQAVREVLNREPHLTMGEWSIFQMGWNSGGSSGSRHQGKTILLWAGLILFFCVCLNILENEVYFPIKTISRLRFSSLSSNVYNSYGSWKIHFKFQWIVENPLQK